MFSRVPARIPSLSIWRSTNKTTPSNLLSRTSYRGFADVWGQREKGMENQTVRSHDEELLEKLRQAEKAQQQAESRVKVVEAAYEEKFGEKAPRKSGSGSVSQEEFLDFQKDMIEKLRSLEDDIHDLKYSSLKRK